MFNNSVAHTDRREMKKPVSADFLLAVFLFLMSPGRQRTPDSTEETGTYRASWDGPFLTVFFGKLSGYLPSQFTFRETDWKKNRREEFSMTLTDDDGQTWLRLNSDTTRPSTIRLPRKPQEVLNHDVVRFMRMIRELFRDSSHHSMKGTFTFYRRKLFAETREYDLTGDETRKYGRARAFTILTFDSTGVPDIRGRVLVSPNGMFHYRKVSVYLPEDEIKITLEEQHD